MKMRLLVLLFVVLLTSTTNVVDQAEYDTENFGEAGEYQYADGLVKTITYERIDEWERVDGEWRKK